MKSPTSLESLEQTRRHMLSLCESGRYAAANLLLVGGGYSAEKYPGFWEALARSAGAQKNRTVAHAARRTLWDAGQRSADTAIAEASHFLDAGDHQAASYVIRAVFGDVPAEPTARLLLAQSYLERLRMEADGDRPRADREIARALSEGLDGKNRGEARVLVDILRFSGEYDRALRSSEGALSRFPDDLPLLDRRARILEQIGDVDGALGLFEKVAASWGEHRVPALFKILDINGKLSREEAHANTAARLTLEPLSYENRLRLAIEMGQPAVVDALISELIEVGDDSPETSAEDKRAVSRLLLDHGYFGHLVWMRRSRYPVEAAVKDVIDASGFGVNGDRIPPRDFASAKRIRSPDFMIPVEDYLGLPAKPSGWPGHGRRPERLLIVSTSLSLGGAERQLVALVRALIAQSHLRPDQIHIACFSLSESRGHSVFRAEVDALGASVYDLEAELARRRPLDTDLSRLAQALPLPLRRDLIAVGSLVSELRPDAIHAWQDKAVLAAGLVAHVYSIERVVLSFRNMSPATRRLFPIVRYKSLFRSYADTERFRMTANAAIARRDYASWLGVDEKRFDRLSNAVDVGVFESIRRRPTAPDGSANVNLAGIFRLATNKRPSLWLQIVARLREILPFGIQPVLFGDGPLLRSVEEEAAGLGLSDLIVETNKTDFADIYGTADAVLLTSRVEGVPNVVLEAQACGLPVAACNVGGVSEALQTRGAGGGLLIPAEPDHAEAANQIAAWLPGALQAAVGGRVAFVERHFSADTMARAAMRLYTGARSTG